MTESITPPSSTYRLQIRQKFQFEAAAAIADYLQTLGTGAIYLSPILQATSGSDHGYDIVSHDLVDPERGGEDGRLKMVTVAKDLGLQTVVDIVPNHMGVADAAQTAPWWDLLRHGQESQYAAWFDVDWAAGDGKVLLPVLGDDFTDDQLSLTEGELRYFEHRFPIAPGTGEGSPAEVHARQHYRLMGYRAADTEQNYRRFFAVTDLAGIRVENEAVFDASHAEILRWVSTGSVDGIRIDHPDGLADPGTYLERLAAAAPGQWITVEKITEPGERLPAGWPVAGTTGYDALSELNNLLYDPAAETQVSNYYIELTGDTRDFDAHYAQGKRMIAQTILRAEILRLTRLVTAAGLTNADVPEALTELAVAFTVYRSYHPIGAEHLTEAAALAGERNPELAATVEALLPLLADAGTELSIRFEQATGAIMAKGVEDTAYYRYNRAIGLNEVGGNPGGFGSTVADFHAAQVERQRLLPQSMTTLSTHDTKRSEDVRARLAVLAELGEPWHRVAARLLDKAPIANRAFGYLLWQTFVGAGFIDRERMHAYAEKAMREANDPTGWRDQDAAFEKSVHTAVDRAYDDPEIHDLLAEIISQITPYGWVNSLSQKLVQLCMPGVPDVYQGTELFDYSLVDPDNRRAVDFASRRALLTQLDSGGRSAAVDATGAAKLWLTSQALRERRDHPELFTDYTALVADGPATEHLVAFDRGGVVAVATRLPLTLQREGGWRDTVVRLPSGTTYRDRLTGTEHTGEVLVSQLLAVNPVALLTSAL